MEQNGTKIYRVGYTHPALGVLVDRNIGTFAVIGVIDTLLLIVQTEQNAYANMFQYPGLYKLQLAFHRQRVGLLLA